MFFYYHKTILKINNFATMASKNMPTKELYLFKYIK